MTSRRAASVYSPTLKETMFQKSSGQTPPPAMAAAMAKFETAQLEQLAGGVANYGAMPRTLNSQQREAVMTMARRLNPSL